MRQRFFAAFLAIVFIGSFLLASPLSSQVQLPQQKKLQPKPVPIATPTISSVTPNSIKIIQGGAAESVTVKGGNLTSISSVQVLKDGQVTQAVTAKLLDPRSATEQKVEFTASGTALLGSDYTLRIVYLSKSFDIPNQLFSLEVSAPGRVVQAKPTSPIPSRPQTPQQKQLPPEPVTTTTPTKEPTLKSTTDKLSLAQPTPTVDKVETTQPGLLGRTTDISLIRDREKKGPYRIAGANLNRIQGAAVYLNGMHQKEIVCDIDEQQRTETYLDIFLGASYKAVPGDNYRLLLGYTEKEDSRLKTMPDSTSLFGYDWKKIEVPVNLHVKSEAIVKLAWQTIIDEINKYVYPIGILIHTRGEDYRYDNDSFIMLPDVGRQNLDIPMIQLSGALGEFRYLARYIYCVPPKYVYVTKQNCSANQLKLVVPFEDDGKELKGYNYNSVFGWNDDGAPDLHLDNMVITLTLDFKTISGRLLFSISDSNLDCRIHADSDMSNDLMNLFLGEWHKTAKKNINEAIKYALSSENMLTHMAQLWFDSVLRELETIAQVKIDYADFKQDVVEVHVIY